MLRGYRLFSALCALSFAAFAQRTPQQIQQRQLNVERAAQQDALNREAQVHQAQMEQMRRIDRQQAEQQNQLTEQQLKAQALAAQEQLYRLQQAEQQRQQQETERQSQAQDQSTPHYAQAAIKSPSPERPLPQTTASHWSFNNMTTADKIGLAALGLLLAVLAVAAGIIPVRLFHPGFTHE